MESTVLLVFTRVPVPGQVKTRLIPGTGGAAAACALYVHLAERTLAQCQGLGFAGIEVWCSEPPRDNPHCLRWQQRWLYRWRVQQGADLGERMCHAFSAALQEHTAAVLIGCDCIGLTGADLGEARHALENGSRVVLGPSTDGGYYLLGLRENHPALFSAMPWGGSGVAEQTCLRCNRMGMPVHELPRRRDLDRPDDLKYLDDKVRRRVIQGDFISEGGAPKGVAIRAVP